MSIKEKTTYEDLIPYEIFRNPVLFNEFSNNYDRREWEEEFEFTWYQREMLCDFNQHISICTARATGKTVALVSIFTWALVFNLFPEDYLVYTVPSKVHLQPVWTGLVRNFRSNSLLKQFIAKNSGFNSSAYEVTLLSQANLKCRIAGQTGTGANVIGLHTPFVLLDEGGYYPWGTWIELQPIVNTFTQGWRLATAGVPTGVRENNVLYYTDKEDSSYTKHRVSAYDNPRFGPEDEVYAIDQYGGKESDDFIHLVLGQHGSPIFSIFDRNLMEISDYNVYKMSIDGIKMKENLGEYYSKLSMFPDTPASSQGVVIGIDLGYTDPTAIIIMYLDRNGRLKFHGRIQLNKVSYNIQDKLIDLLDTKFQPSIIGIDEGSAGKAVVQRLQEAEIFSKKRYKDRLMPINFSSQISLGFDSDGNEIKEKTKPFSVSVLQEYSNNHKIVYSSKDLELVSELERMTYSKNPNGDISYRTLTQRGGKRGEDHFTAALLCGSLAYYLENESLLPTRKVVKLFSVRWL